MQALKLLCQIYLLICTDEQNLQFANFFYDHCTCSKTSILALAMLPKQTSTFSNTQGILSPRYSEQTKTCHMPKLSWKTFSSVTGLNVLVQLIALKLIIQYLIFRFHHPQQHSEKHSRGKARYMPLKCDCCFRTAPIDICFF